jgi:microcystin-dependent protein
VANLKIKKGIDISENINPFFIAGDIISIFSSHIPDGWLLCDGSEYLQNSYPDLFAVFSNYYNNGLENPGHFRLPNLSGATGYPVYPVGTIGSDNSGTILGGGYYNHTHELSYGGDSNSLLVNDFISHSHGSVVFTGFDSTASFQHRHGSSRLSANSPSQSQAPSSTITTRANVNTAPVSARASSNHLHSISAGGASESGNSSMASHSHTVLSGGNFLNNNYSTSGFSSHSHDVNSDYVATTEGTLSNFPTLYVRYIVKV